MTESKWIKFVKDNGKAPRYRKTDVYDIFTKDNQHFLGKIKWHAPWRKYCFYPTTGIVTIFETQCLKDIIAFIDSLMQERKKEKNAVQEAK